MFAKRERGRERYLLVWQHAAGFGCGDFRHIIIAADVPVRGAGSVVDHAYEGNDIIKIKSSMTINISSSSRDLSQLDPELG